MGEQLELGSPAKRNAWLDMFRPKIQAWAKKGVYFGGSSWKYEGWVGQIYTQDRYLVRGKFSKKKFEQECLTEYAETFPFVGADFSFYTFYGEAFWQKLFAQVPAGFQFGFKCPERITAPTFGNHPRYGVLAGRNNDNFLDADLLKHQFLDRLTPYKDKVGFVVFEMPQFHKVTPESTAQFLELLDEFLSRLPKSFRYAVELRTKKFLTAVYFAVLHRHNVSHAFNSWSRMPSVGEQLNLPGSITAKFAAARLLLKPGRSYEDAVKAFQPYDKIRDPFPEIHQDAMRLVKSARKVGEQVFLSVNNRLEGNSPSSIAQILDALEASP